MLDEKKLAAMIAVARGRTDTWIALSEAGFLDREIIQYFPAVTSALRAEWARSRFGTAD